MPARERLIPELRRALAPDRVLTDKDRLEECSWDALSESRIHPQRKFQGALPLCVVLPMTTQEVQQVVYLANTYDTAVVPYGGGSGLMGGAISLSPGIVVDLKRMNRILEIDEESRSVCVEAGIVLEALNQGLDKKKLFCGHDPWTVPVATVGGTISTNSLGYRGGKYGSMGEQVLGLEVVLPQGEVLRTRGVPKSSTGLDLKHLFIGGEGCFGIITQATLKVFPVPQETSLQAFRFPSFETGFEAIQKLYLEGIRPSLMDFGDDATKFNGGAVLYLGLEGSRDTVRLEERIATAICAGNGGEKRPQGEAEGFWRDRHVVARRFMHNRRERRNRMRDHLHRDFIHVALPVSEVLSFRKAATVVVAKHGVQLQESGLWTRPELFSMRLATMDGEQNQTNLESAVEDLIGLVHEKNGSMEYCHGVGVKLAPFMVGEHGIALEVMKQMKQVLDPRHIMNPGKMGL
ncbi:MAG: FAD-binding protein [Deltaproteobacteria bacterium]|nr:FAD-binding protein [Deltaproteobacteria bacterium]